jgi:hypothetical protein
MINEAKVQYSLMQCQQCSNLRVRSEIFARILRACEDLRGPMGRVTRLEFPVTGCADRIEPPPTFTDVACPVTADPTPARAVPMVREDFSCCAHKASLAFSESVSLVRYKSNNIRTNAVGRRKRGNLRIAIYINPT